MKTVFLTVADSPLTAYWINRVAASARVDAVVTTRKRQKDSRNILVRKFKRDLEYVRASGSFLRVAARLLTVVLSLPLGLPAALLRGLILSDRKVYKLLEIDRSEVSAMQRDLKVIEAGLVNSGETISLLKELKPDIILVAGTDILKPEVIETAGTAIINIHTGITHYYRGVGSTFAAAVEGRFDRLGFTAHLIDPGIDTGTVLFYQEIPAFPEDSYADILARVYRKVPDGYLKALGLAACGELGGIEKQGTGRLVLSTTRFYGDPALDITVMALRLCCRRLLARLRGMLPQGLRVFLLKKSMLRNGPREKESVSPARLLQKEDFSPGSLLCIAPHPDDVLIGALDLVDFWNSQA
ncbi:MAG: hypothetical protein JXQ83_07135, partial [Candidatus Glassbacteria bacterium]|nr:hypothetical protein [Candidatus Glassbacteria bacterium]